METIKSLINRLNRVVTSEKGLNGVSIECNIKGIKRYEWAYYFELYDGDTNISGYIQKQNVTVELKEGSRMQVKGSIKIDRYNKVSFQITGYTIKDTIIETPYMKVLGRLNGEGLLNIPKRPIHNRYNRIGLITSTNAAGLKDVLSTLRKNMRKGEILIYPTLVQGTGMVGSIIGRIEQANREDRCDILLIARGGGSRSDLEWFDNYDLAKCITGSRIPIVCGIGHEVDRTIVDAVVDRSFITPTDAAGRLTDGHLESTHIIDGLLGEYNRMVEGYIGRIGLLDRYYNLKRRISWEYENMVRRMVNNYNIGIGRGLRIFNDMVQRYGRHNRIGLIRGLLDGYNSIRIESVDKQIDGVQRSIRKYEERMDTIKRVKVVCGDNVITTRDEMMRYLLDGGEIRIGFIDGEYVLKR